MVVADPLEHYLNADIIKGREQRVALTPVMRLLATHRAVLLFTRHLNQAQGQKALYRGRGDMTLLGLARMGFLVADDPNAEEAGVHVLAATKANLGPKPPSLRYRVVEAENGAARIEWLGASSRNADQLVGSLTATPSTAEEVLRSVILPRLQSQGPMLSKDGDAILREHGVLSRDTINRAKAKLGIKSHQRQIGTEWWWLLKGQEIPADASNPESRRNIGVSDSGPDSEAPRIRGSGTIEDRGRSTQSAPAPLAHVSALR